MENIPQKFFELLAFIWKNLVAIVFETLKFFLTIIFQFIPLDWIAHKIKDNLPELWNWFMGLSTVKKAVSTAVFRKFGSVTEPRPHPFTMAADYTTWHGFVDRTFTGRHLPADRKIREQDRPDMDRVVEFFMRGSKGDNNGHQINDIRSSLLFASFAQWFTDSFLRTSHSFKFDDDGNVVRDASGAPIREEGRETKNESNHEIDLCQIYCLNNEQTSMLRLNSEDDRGCLKFQLGKDGEYPEFLLEKAPSTSTEKLLLNKSFRKLHPDERILRSIFLRAESNTNGYETIFATGLEHGNATIGNSLLNIIFLREHNRVARLIAASEPNWDDEHVFQTTRNTMTVILLKIVISDYVRHISALNLPLEFQPGLAENENWYRSNRIHIEFNILYRWHSLVPDEFSFMPEPENPSAFRHNNQWLMDTGIAQAVSLFSKEPAGRMIIGNTPRFLKGVKLDTIKIMRASNLASYNEYRKRFNLPVAKKFEDITDDENIIRELRDMYNDEIDDVEWYIGMCAEQHDRGMIMGQLMFNMVAHDAFTHALTNPLLSNQTFVPKTFSKVGWNILNETSTLEDVVKRVVKPGDDVTCSFAIKSDQLGSAK